MVAVEQAGVGLIKYLQVMSSKRVVGDERRVNLQANHLGHDVAFCLHHLAIARQSKGTHPALWLSISAP